MESGGDSSPTRYASKGIAAAPLLAQRVGATPPPPTRKNYCTSSAGALTSRYYGESEALLGKYAWFLRNAEDHSWPVGGKKPNDLGLFDMHGNVWSWCQESYKAYPKATADETFDDIEDDASDVSPTLRVSRGVSFLHTASFVRSATRNWDSPTSQYSSYGFRVARTFR